MTKNKAVLPNMQWQPLPAFDPATIAAPAPAPVEDGGHEFVSTVLPATIEVPAAAAKRKHTTAKKAPMRQRGLHLEDSTILKLRTEALQRGMTASRLANQILSKALAS